MNIQIPKRFRERYANLVEDKEAFFSSLESQTPKSFRVNTLKASVHEVRERFESYGFSLKQAPWYQEAFVSENPSLGSTLEHFLGYIYVQDLTSMLPVLAVRKELEHGMKVALPPSDKHQFTVLDACAAPGSKSTQLAAFMQNQGSLVANDLDYERIKALKFNLERCGALNSMITNQDLRFFPEKHKFDLILLDVPCSSEGTVRKNPEALRHWSESDISSKSGLQKKLLLKAWNLLRSGGTLVYSTCTFAPEENELVVSSLLENPGAKIQDVRIPGLKCSPGILEWKGKELPKEVKKAVRVWPHQNDTDGFFLAKMVKE